MKPIHIYSKLLLLSVLLMGMGFPTVISEEDTDSDKGSKSGRYVKVGFLACSRQVSEAQHKGQVPTTGCVGKTKKTGLEKTKTSGEAGAPLADNAQIITKHVCWLFNK